jgi:hypothetical protein
VKYRLEGEVNEKSIKDFLSKFFAKKLKPYLKSEPLPEDNSGPVKTVVSKNFNDIVLDKKKVSVWFCPCVVLTVGSTSSSSSTPRGAVWTISRACLMYSRAAGHCKQLSPIWDELGEYFAKHEEVVCWPLRFVPAV